MWFYCLQAGQTPLLLAVRNNNVVIVKELVGAKVDVNYLDQVRSSSVYYLSLGVFVITGRTLCSDDVL